MRIQTRHKQQLQSISCIYIIIYSESSFSLFSFIRLLIIRSNSITNVVEVEEEVAAVDTLIYVKIIVAESVNRILNRRSGCVVFGRSFGCSGGSDLGDGGGSRRTHAWANTDILYIIQWANRQMGIFLTKLKQKSVFNDQKQKKLSSLS
ncbi:hypothetical protein DPMN_113297 [Dreissena polymorpha]|uniref:Uncharacterized protein n=1 Tax=Dreissena polymorpha TaxID=45954 RepID=A0A9D4KI23_DREPO|nr:hypothetical protein DPMN_113297 [Dreissena polymorpha]